ncbi:hypothetical protein GCM10010430_35410 [Kitasatospora cystarginea]|uniref:PPM-type phosphatase domain-containing protein n=1 Tax=Kitasatospora cystarginea TaxID=58350 RepID=A0ABN3E6B6_9ACTN
MQVELAGEPQEPGRQTEDFAAASPEALVLLDGSSSPAGMESGCRHGTAWYVRRLGVHLLARLTDRSDRSISECLADAIVETAALHGGRCDLAHPNTPAAMVVAARLHGKSLEYLVLGDSLLILHPKDGPPRVIGDNQRFPGGEQLRRQVWATVPARPNGRPCTCGTHWPSAPPGTPATARGSPPPPPRPRPGRRPGSSRCPHCTRWPP